VTIAGVKRDRLLPESPTSLVTSYYCCVTFAHRRGAERAALRKQTIGRSVLRVSAVRNSGN